jgi:hypothetical protein
LHTDDYQELSWRGSPHLEKGTVNIVAENQSWSYKACPTEGSSSSYGGSQFNEKRGEFS